MANWKQIQGRIRRARTSADPLNKLTELFQKTRDPMVAYEVGALEEKSGRSTEAVHWYTTAAARFRRADWRKRAADALARLGASAPETAQLEMKPQPDVHDDFAEESSGMLPESAAEESSEFLRVEQNDEPQPADSAEQEAPATSTAAPSHTSQHRKRRRGRRGGKRHRRKSAAEHAPQQSHLSRPAHTHQVAQAASNEERPQVTRPDSVELELPAAAEFREISAAEISEPPRIFERATYIRAGDPALSSRFAHLESLLRRLISAPLHRIEEAGEAPAGPGVLLLSDSDLMTSYYIQACQTLRIGAGQIAKPGRSGRGAREEKSGALRSRLAEHLEISENQAGDYLKKHCSLRWLQLDDEAPHLAHFAIAILRPALNNE